MPVESSFSLRGHQSIDRHGKLIAPNRETIELGLVRDRYTEDGRMRESFGVASAFFNDPNSGNRVEYTGPHGWRLVDEEGYERQSVYDKFSRGEVRGNYGNLKIDVPLGADVDRDVLDAASDGLDYFLQHADELKLVEQSTDQGGQTPSMPTAPPTQPAPSV